jgi:CheY-like chemotaxis protein
VLVVDDDASLRALLASVLEDAGYTVVQASDGKPALDLLRQHAEGLVVLLDLHMPMVSGYEVLRAVEAEAPLLTRHAYLVMSAEDGPLPVDFAQMLARHDIPYFTKPFAVQAVLDAVAVATARLGESARQDVEGDRVAAPTPRTEDKTTERR